MNKNSLLKTFLFFIVLISSVLKLNGQITFEKTYDFPPQIISSYSALPVSDGYILLGQSTDTSGPNQTNLLIKTNEFGDTIWSKRIGGYSTARYSQMILCSDSTVRIVGRGWYNSKDSPVITQYNLSSDSLVTTIVFPYDTSLYSLYTVPTGICELSDGNYIISGYRESYSTFDYVFFVMKIDSLYNTIWLIDTITSGGQIRMTDIIETSDNEILIQIEEGYGGAASPFSCILKLDSNGNKLWFKSGYRDHSLYSLSETPGHEYILCGNWFPPMTGPNPTYSGYVERLDTSGNTIWRDTNVTDYYNSLCSTYNDGIAVVGYTPDLNNIRHAFLRLYDNIGQVVYHRYFRADLYGYFNCIKPTADSGFIISGTSTDIMGLLNSTSDFYLIKTDKNGNILSSINSNLISEDLEVFPNPFYDKFNINLRNGNYQIRIYNSSGSLVYNSNKTGMYTIDFSDFSPGVYVLRILNETSKMGSTIKLVKMEK